MLANVVIILQGSQNWTLIDPVAARALRPSPAHDFRAYFTANVDPASRTWRERVVGHTYHTMLHEGDILFVPAWWWTRVDYVPEVTSMSVSINHFRPGQLLPMQWDIDHFFV